MKPYRKSKNVEDRRGSPFKKALGDKSLMQLSNQMRKGMYVAAKAPKSRTTAEHKTAKPGTTAYTRQTGKRDQVKKAVDKFRRKNRINTN